MELCYHQDTKRAYEFLCELHEGMRDINANIADPTFIGIAQQKGDYSEGLYFTKANKDGKSEIYLPTKVIAKILVDYIASLKLEETPDL